MSKKAKEIVNKVTEPAEMSERESTFRYRARMWRMRPCIDRCEEDLEIMIYALMGEGKKLEFDYSEKGWEVKGYEFGPKNHWRVNINQWTAEGQTRAGALAGMLRILLDGCWVPLT